MSFFSRNFRFLRVIFVTRNKKKSRPTEPTWKVRPPVKQGCFFRRLITENNIIPKESA